MYLYCAKSTDCFVAFDKTKPFFIVKQTVVRQTNVNSNRNLISDNWFSLMELQLQKLTFIGTPKKIKEKYPKSLYPMKNVKCLLLCVDLLTSLG